MDDLDYPSCGYVIMALVTDRNNVSIITKYWHVFSSSINIDLFDSISHQFTLYNNIDFGVN